MSTAEISSLRSLRDELAYEAAEMQLLGNSMPVREGVAEWRDIGTSCPDTNKYNSRAKQYLLLTGLLEVHSSKPSWVRLLPLTISKSPQLCVLPFPNSAPKDAL